MYNYNITVLGSLCLLFPGPWMQNLVVVVVGLDFLFTCMWTLLWQCKRFSSCILKRWSKQSRFGSEGFGPVSDYTSICLFSPHQPRPLAPSYTAITVTTTGQHSLLCAHSTPRPTAEVQFASLCQMSDCVSLLLVVAMLAQVESRELAGIIKKRRTAWALCME